MLYTGSLHHFANVSQVNKVSNFNFVLHVYHKTITFFYIELERNVQTHLLNRLVIIGINPQQHPDGGT